MRSRSGRAERSSSSAPSRARSPAESRRRRRRCSRRCARHATRRSSPKRRRARKRTRGRSRLPGGRGVPLAAPLRRLGGVRPRALAPQPGHRCGVTRRDRGAHARIRPKPRDRERPRGRTASPAAAPASGSSSRRLTPPSWSASAGASERLSRQDASRSALVRTFVLSFAPRARLLRKRRPRRAIAARLNPRPNTSSGPARSS